MTDIDYSKWRGPLSQTYGPAPVNGIEFTIGLDIETSKPVTVKLADLLAQRLLIQGNSGAGKTTLVKHILNLTRPTQQIIVDQEGEYTKYVSEWWCVCNGDNAKSTAATARRHKWNVLLDVMQLKSEPKLIVIADFVERLIEAPKEQWSPLIVVIDECHIFTPRISSGVITPTVRRRCTSAIIELMTLGRKRGISTIVVTPRLSELNPTVRSSPQNYMIGFTMHDVDIHRAAELLGWPVKQATAVLAKLPAGVFVCAGLAFGRTPRIVRVGAS